MLAALTALNPPNVEVLAADLVDLDLSARGWAGSFDLVWACMTPISGDPRGLAQLERASRGQVCCITWGPNRQDPLFEEAFALHGSTFRPPAWREAIAAHARSRGHRLVHELIPNRMEQHIAPEALVIDLAHHLRWLGIEPDERRLGDWAAARARDGLVHRSLDADQEIWLWTL